MTIENASSDDAANDLLGSEQDVVTDDVNSDANIDGGKDDDGADAEAAAEAAKKAEEEAAADNVVSMEKHHNLQNALAQQRHITRDLKAQMGKMDDRFKQVMEAKSKEDDKPTTSFEDDPLANLKEQNDILQKQIAEMKDGGSKDADGANTDQKLSDEDIEMGHQINDMALEFIDKQPDYPQAYEFFVKSITDELRETGYAGADLVVQLNTRLDKMISTAMDRADNPAEIAYKQAIKRGYVKADTDSKGGDGKKPASGGNGKDLNKLKDDMDRNASLGAGGGGDDLSLSEMADMKDDEFDAALKERFL